MALRDASEIYSLNPEQDDEFKRFIDETGKNGDTLGGVVEVRVEGLPFGLGTHSQWDRKLDGLIARAVMAVQAIKGVEIGLGFEAARRPGSQVHDPIEYQADQAEGNTLGYTRPTNNAGGLEAGMTNGQPLIVRAAKKPISTLRKPLASINMESKQSEEAAYERSDVCAVSAASVIVENVVAFEVAGALIEKFGGDSLAEMKARWDLFHQLARRAINRSSQPIREDRKRTDARGNPAPFAACRLRTVVSGTHGRRLRMDARPLAPRADSAIGTTTPAAVGRWSCGSAACGIRDRGSSDLEDVRLSDLESLQPLAPRLAIGCPRDRPRLATGDPRVDDAEAALPSLWQIVHQRLVREDALARRIAHVSVQQLTLERTSTATHLARCELGARTTARCATLATVLRSATDSSPSQGVRVDLHRDRSAAEPVTRLTIDTGEMSLPLSLVATVLGHDWPTTARFRGRLPVVWQDGRWRAEFVGQTLRLEPQRPLAQLDRLRRAGNRNAERQSMRVRSTAVCNRCKVD